MKPYGQTLKDSPQWLLMYEKDHKYNFGVREGCQCSFCKTQYSIKKRGKRYKTSRISIQNAMRACKKKARQLNKKLSAESFMVCTQFN
jgi:hypothetical protein